MVSRKMNVYEYPTHQELDSLLSRPAHDASHLTATVSAVLEDVRLHGDQAVIKYEKQFDHAELTDLAVTEAEMEEAERLVPEDLKQAIIQAHGNIETFHASQKFHAPLVQVTEGVEC